MAIDKPCQNHTVILTFAQMQPVVGDTIHSEMSDLLRVQTVCRWPGSILKFQVIVILAKIIAIHDFILIIIKCCLHLKMSWNHIGITLTLILFRKKHCITNRTHMLKSISTIQNSIISFNMTYASAWLRFFVFYEVGVYVACFLQVLFYCWLPSSL